MTKEQIDNIIGDYIYYGDEIMPVISAKQACKDAMIAVLNEVDKDFKEQYANYIIGEYGKSLDPREMQLSIDTGYSTSESHIAITNKIEEIKKL